MSRANLPEVKYKDVGIIAIGKSCLVYPIDHYSVDVSNKTWARTSPVISYDPDTGIFATENTLYIPEYQ